MAKVISFENVSYVRNQRAILSDLNWSVDSSERWVILGPNGAGKSTMLKLASAADHPSAGVVQILGKQLGKVDVFELRTAIGAVTRATERLIPFNETVLNVVMTAAYGVAGRWHEDYEDLDVRRATRVLQEWNLAHLAERNYGTLSDGERKRALLARAVMTDPELLLLDEPAASIDLGGREQLLQSLSGFAQSPAAPAMVMVTHHVEEIPPGFTHVLLLNGSGQVQAQGELQQVLTAENLSAAFGVNLELTLQHGRYFAHAR
ncbi:ABC transporter ATP-binding protein [Canibacter oris]|uniref:Iron complex transport system ATP-binding protein n=1 Tax=Canibacter oris TaxID=1365628 RepID=A0A840DRT0_9MICO|nr:ABC transporter ATP-binding protein [Canibacter oris]MBB4071856.1 iron complex transport system ATP-binding protein [Canibacter oris]